MQMETTLLAIWNEWILLFFCLLFWGFRILSLDWNNYCFYTCQYEYEPAYWDCCNSIIYLASLCKDAAVSRLIRIKIASISTQQGKKTRQAD